MPDVTKPGLGWQWLVVAGLTCAAGLAAGYYGQPEASTAVVARDLTPLSEEVRYKVPVSISQPKRGPADALVTIVEWCALTGAACRQAESTIVDLRKQYGDRIRHVWRHLPVDTTDESARAHEFASIAQEHAAKFWEARALLLASDHGPSQDDIKSYAGMLGMDVEGTSAALEKHTFAGGPGADTLFAAKFGVATGPAFFVNGRRLLGAPSRERLARLIDLELAHAEKVARRGIKKDELYDEITKSGLWGVAGSSVARSR